MGVHAYATDHKDHLAGGGYHQYDNLVGQTNRGNTMYFISNYVGVTVEPTYGPGSSPMPPEAGASYRIPSRDNAMYCPANTGNVPEDAFPFGSQWRPDYMLRGFGTLDASTAGGFNRILGYPRLDAIATGFRGFPVNLLQDMIYLPGSPTVFPEHERKFTNHWAGTRAGGGNVTAADGSVGWVDGDRFTNPLDDDRVAAPLGYVTAFWGFPVLSDPTLPFNGQLTVALPDGTFENSQAAFRGLGY